MYVALRIIRGLVGFVAAWQIVGLIQAIGWLSNLDAINGGAWTFIFAKFLFTAIFVMAFFGLRSLINKLHIRKYGAPHPAMHTQWAL